jgi:hypothetical protein
VKWDDICKPKKEAGLGIRDLRLVNLSLLAKWRWKLLSHEKEVWKDVIIAKYGPDNIGIGNLGEAQVMRVASTWWRDICVLDKNSNWFADAVEKRVRDGVLTSFWNEKWLGDIPLYLRFPRIFSVSSQQTATVSSMGSWVGGVWRWEFIWRRSFFEWEIPLYQEFLLFTQDFEPVVGEDIWRWRENKDAGFSVKTCYFLLLR